MNANFWKGMVAAWVTASVIVNVVNGLLLQSVWSVLEAQRVIRYYGGIMTAMVGFEVILFIGVYILCEFVEKLSQVKRAQPWKVGLQIGILLGMAQVAGFLMYPVPVVVPIVGGLGEVVAMTAAALVYSKLDPQRT